MSDPYNFDDQEPEAPSKSQLKREMHALQGLGSELVELKDSQLNTIELPQDLYNAIIEMRKITKNEARRRHMQFIGKLMRNADGDAIAEGLARLRTKSDLYVQQQHLAEQWRDRLLGAESGALEAFISQYPAVEIQHLRQLIRQAQKEQSQNKPPAHARKLFRYVRDTLMLAE